MSKMKKTAEEIYDALNNVHVSKEEAVALIEAYAQQSPALTDPEIQELGVQIGTSSDANFEDNTWTFEMEESMMEVCAGKFAIVPITEYARLKACQERNEVAKVQTYVVDFGGNVLARIEVKGSTINITNAINGYGSSIALDTISVTPEPPSTTKDK